MCRESDHGLVVVYSSFFWLLVPYNPNLIICTAAMFGAMKCSRLSQTITIPCKPECTMVFTFVNYSAFVVPGHVLAKD